MIMGKKQDNLEMPLTHKGIRFMIMGLLVMVAGYVLMAGGGSDDPNVFNYAMFDWRRLVAAPVVILCGVVIEIVAIMGMTRKDDKKQ